MPEATATIGQRLRTRRVALGLTLAQVAERSGLSLPYVSNLERGRGNPTVDALASLAEALEVELPALVGADANTSALDVTLASAPRSLLSFARSSTFAAAVDDLAARQGTTSQVMRQRLLDAMAASPRRASGEPTEDDWRRLLDAYSLILAR